MCNLTVLIIYVDDMIVTWDDKAKILRLTDYLATKFKIKYLGGLKYVFDIEVPQ